MKMYFDKILLIESLFLDLLICFIFWMGVGFTWCIPLLFLSLLFLFILYSLNIEILK